MDCWCVRYPWLFHHPKTLATPAPTPTPNAKLTHKNNKVDTVYRNMKVNSFHFWKQLSVITFDWKPKESPQQSSGDCSVQKTPLNALIASPFIHKEKSSKLCYTKSLISNVHSKFFCPLDKNIWMLQGTAPQNTRQLHTKLIRHRTNRHVSRTLHQGGKWTQKVKLMLLCPQCQLQVSEDADHTLHSQTLTIISTSSWPGHSSSKWVVHNAACKLLHGTNQR